MLSCLVVLHSWCHVNMVVSVVSIKSVVSFVGICETGPGTWGLAAFVIARSDGAVCLCSWTSATCDQPQPESRPSVFQQHTPNAPSSERVPLGSAGEPPTAAKTEGLLLLKATANHTQREPSLKHTEIDDAKTIRTMWTKETNGRLRPLPPSLQIVTWEKQRRT